MNNPPEHIQTLTPGAPARPAFADPAGLLWQAGRPGAGRRVLATGHPALDAALADGGWPRGALSELLLPAPGIGELPLLWPALLAELQAGARVALVAPPFVPCSAAWQAGGVDARRLWWLDPPDARSWLWSSEQLARVSGCVVLAWPGRYPLAMAELRRLQLAAREGDNLVALLRPAGAASQASPAALRLELAGLVRGQLQVTVRKQRGGFAGAQVTVPVHAARSRKQLAAWQLPVHLPIPAPRSLSTPEERIRVVARPAPAGTDAGAPAPDRRRQP